jgi:hypothetical protein
MDQSEEQIKVIKDFVDTESKTWYAGNKRLYHCKVRIFLDVVETGITAPEARANMVKRIISNSFLFDYFKAGNYKKV